MADDSKKDGGATTDAEGGKEGEEKKGLLGAVGGAVGAVGGALGKGLNTLTPGEKKEEKRPPLLKGNYMIHVHCIEGRDLKGRGMGDMSDSVARVEVMGQKQHTKIMKKNLNPLWDEVLVFEFKELYPEEIERGKCIIKVMDANTIRKDVLIGLFEFDLAQIYYGNHHELYRQWCALTDVTDKNEGIQGYLKCSITVLGPKDEMYIHSAADADDEDGGMLGVLMPPEVEQHGKLLKISALYVDELPVMDEGLIGGKCDPYVWVEFAGVDVKTKPFKGKQKADMLKSLQVPVMEPTMSNVVRIHVYDWDQTGQDDRISSFTVDYQKIKDVGGVIKPRWHMLYGAPEGYQRDEASRMNKGIIPGTWYRGKVMLGFEVEDSKEPKKSVTDISGLMPEEQPPMEKYRIQFDLYEGSEIPEKGPLKKLGQKGGKVTVEVHCGKSEMKSEKCEVKEGRCEWYQALPDMTVSLPKDTSQCPDIFVYLCLKPLKKVMRVSYLRFPFAKLFDKGWKVPPVWHILRECQALDALDKSEFPGSLLFSIRVGLESAVPKEVLPESRPLLYDDVDLSSYGVDDGDEVKEEIKIEVQQDTKMGPPGSPSPEPTGGDEKSAPHNPKAKFTEGKVAKLGDLTLEVIEAVNLPALDRGGTSDPYVKLFLPMQKDKKTKVIKKTLAPKWGETFNFSDVNIQNELSFEVWDNDLVGKDEMMGTGKVDLATIQQYSKVEFGRDFTHDRWFLLDNCKSSTAKIHMKFSFKYLSVEASKSKEAEQATKAMKSQKSIFNVLKKEKKQSKSSNSVLGNPQRRNCQLRCHLYQARNLPALDSNGLADPYVIMRCAGKKIKFKKREKTLNPVWYETQSMNVNVPFPWRFSPRLQIFIYDWDQVGKDDPLGRFSITMDEILKLNPGDEINPKWYDITDFEGNYIDEAQLLASFQLMEADKIDAPPKEIRPPTTPMTLEITTLGLRNLQSTLGVHKTFLDFEIPNGKKFGTRQSNKPTAKSPNFLQVLKIPVDLPIAKIFAPALRIMVRDVLFGGLIKRVIGASSLNLEDFMESDEKGGWRPAAEAKIPSDAEIEEEIKAEEKAKQEAEAAKKEEELKRKLAEAQRLAEEEAEKERLAEAAGSQKEPLLAEGGASDEKDHKIEVKDEGVGVGDLGAGGKGEGNPLLGIADAATVKEEFKEADQKFDKYDPEEDAKLPDEPEEIPKYMRGRVVVDDELEDNMRMKPFHTVTISTGQKNAGPLQQKWRKVGIFKGLIRLMDEKSPPSEIDTKALLQPQELYCRLYILRAYGLTPKDDDGTSDPYLIIKLGSTKISTRDRHINDNLEPEFFESFEIPCILPGDATLEITCMDWDGIGDDLIGKTEIDIEDRWFSKDWKKLGLKPLERRTLRSKTSTHSQGKLELWLELLTPEQAKRTPMEQIKPPPPSPWELRVIVWGTREVTIKDTFTNQNDLFVTCAVSIPGIKKQETDTHFRSKKGKGNFNWRMKFPINLPIKPWPRLRFQIWDLDIFSPNDSICETVMTLKGLCKRAMKKKDRIKLYVKGKDRFTLDNLKHPNFGENQGKMDISLEIMPADMASQLPAGFGRSDPNTNPFLPPPEGRVNWSLLHPLDMLKEIFGPELYRKMLCGCICMLVTAACVFMAPMIASNVISNILTPGK